jgi:hypothetical protein
MESMDNVRERIEALEQQMKVMGAHTRTVERRLRWWRGIACGVGLLGLVSLPLQSGTAADTQPGGMAERMAALEKKLGTMAFDDAANEVVITGANLRIVNGLGNLIVGYNESRALISGIDTRTGSHNVVVGSQHNFSSFGGLVVGLENEISGEFATVTGGRANKARGRFASVSGGTDGEALAQHSSVSGGINNIATGFAAWLGGGATNRANGDQSVVSGGIGNTASGVSSSVSGGTNNTASGLDSSVSGGENNTASGDFSSVSGGTNRSAPGTENWAAGPLFADN